MDGPKVQKPVDALLIAELQSVVGTHWVSCDPEIVFAYSRDVNLYPHNLSSVIRPPSVVVLPRTSEEVQRVMTIARKYKCPLTPQATGLNVAGVCVPSRGGILLDLKRMDSIVRIDEAHLTATIEPCVTIARLSRELQTRGLYLPVPGNPSTASVISNILVGLGLKVTNKVGRQDKGIVGFKMILPDGSIFKVGSGADPFILQDFWPHGPGPDLHLFPVHAIGTTGVVTEMTVKCWLKGEQYKELWVSYEDIDGAVVAFCELSRKEICKGINLYGGNKYASYATDTREAIERMIRANPEFQIVVSFEGTSRRLEYEERVVRELAKQTGGKIISDTFKPYETFIESHAGMSGSFYSDYSMKYWGSRGANWVSAGFPSPERLGEQYRAYSQACLDDPEYSDVDFGNAEYWRSMIAYPFEGGHYYFAEHGIDSHPGDPRWQEVVKRIGAAIPRYGAQQGLVMMGFNRAPREGLPKVIGPYYDAARSISRYLDPDGIMQPGFVFP